MVDVDRYFTKEIRVVLLGKTGSGKSACGNTILGSEQFPSGMSGLGNSVTSNCTRKKSLRFGKIIHVVDTPGLFDTKRSNEETLMEITRCIAITSPGPHAFILVLSLSRYTLEDQQCVNHFIAHFGHDIYKYFIIIFTRKDDLDYHKKTLQDHIQSSPDTLKTFVDKCGGRAIAFNNRLGEEERDRQVTQLLHMIENIQRINEGKCYTNDMYIKAEKILRESEADWLKKLEQDMKNEIDKKVHEAIQKNDEDMKKKRREIEERYEKLYANVREDKRKEAEEGKGIFLALFSFAEKCIPFVIQAVTKILEN